MVERCANLLSLSDHPDIQLDSLFRTNFQRLIEVVHMILCEQHLVDYVPSDITNLGSQSLTRCRFVESNLVYCSCICATKWLSRTLHGFTIVDPADVPGYRMNSLEH